LDAIFIAVGLGFFAAARNRPAEKVQALVDQNTEGRFLGVSGELRVNVPKLNFALDAAK